MAQGSEAGKNFCLNLMRKANIFGKLPSEIMMPNNPYPAEIYAFDNIVFHTAYPDWIKEQAAINGNPVK